jgi:hypothetical protein
VLFLVLITHYFGNAVAQGFLHGFAGMFMAFVAISCIIGLDLLIGSLRGPRGKVAHG